MSTPRRLRFVVTTVAWLVLTLLVLSAFGAFSYGLFVLLSVLGFVVIADLLTLSHVRPRWHDRLRAFVAIGIVIAGIAIGFRFVQLFVPGVLP